MEFTLDSQMNARGIMKINEPHGRVYIAARINVISLLMINKFGFQLDCAKCCLQN